MPGTQNLLDRLDHPQTIFYHIKDLLRESIDMFKPPTIKNGELDGPTVADKVGAFWIGLQSLEEQLSPYLSDAYYLNCEPLQPQIDRLIAQRKFQEAWKKMRLVQRALMAEMQANRFLMKKEKDTQQDFVFGKPTPSRLERIAGAEASD